MAKLIFILTMATLAAAWGNLKKPNETPLFSEEGFPKAGDIPLLNRKVFKGTRVSSSEYPYMASIRRNLSHFLTGAILTRNVVITIAHPLFHVPSYELGVVVGESYSDRGTSVRPVLLLLLHQHFDPWTLKHDLALLRIFEEFNFKINLKPIPLAMQSNREAESLDGTTAFVAGWGRCDLMPNHLCLPRSSAYYPGEIQDPMLRSITFTLKTLTPSCDEYSKQGVTIYDGMLCQGVARAYAATAACLAVPGAPLAARGGLLGLQSWGFGCNYAADLPLIYTDLRRYQNWLTTNLELMARIDKTELLLLFEATKSFSLREVMYVTRKSLPPRHSHGDLTMEPIPVDSKLVMLKGKVYDLRDFLGEGYHEEKKEMYRKLKLQIRDSRQPENSSLLTESEETDQGDENPMANLSSTDLANKADSEYYQEVAANAAN